MPFIEVFLSFAAIFGVGAALVLACKRYMEKIDEGKSPEDAYKETLDEVK